MVVVVCGYGKGVCLNREYSENSTGFGYNDNDDDDDNDKDDDGGGAGDV